VTLDKIDLLDCTFSHSFVGYRRDEVDRLVAEAAESLGRLAEEKMSLARTNDGLVREIAEYRAREATLRDTLLTTQRIVEELKGKAREEARRIVEAAKGEAAAIVAEARGQADALAGEIEALAARKAAMTGRLRDMLTAALGLLDAEAATDEARNGSAREGDQEAAGEETLGVLVEKARMVERPLHAAGSGVYLGGEAADTAVSLSLPGQGG
jgi:cell division initiation protein